MRSERFQRRKTVRKNKKLTNRSKRIKRTRVKRSNKSKVSRKNRRSFIKKASRRNRRMRGGASRDPQTRSQMMTLNHQNNVKRNENMEECLASVSIYRINATKSFIPVHKTKWIEDGDANHCANHTCNQSWTATRWKHHCRCCGGVFCGDCSSYTFMTREEDIEPGEEAAVARNAAKYGSFFRAVVAVDNLTEGLHRLPKRVCKDCWLKLADSWEKYNGHRYGMLSKELATRIV